MDRTIGTCRVSSLFDNLFCKMIYTYFQPIQKYLHSIRVVTEETKQILAFDMKFPVRWDIAKQLTPQELINIKEQKLTEQVRYITFFCLYNEQNVNDAFDRIIYVIDKSIEEEKKQELLNKKIQELKDKFNELSLDDLQQLVFKTKTDEAEQALTGS
jgi:hypothetical protein